eukprot:2808307-Amphidinium_carterae.1
MATQEEQEWMDGYIDGCLAALREELVEELKATERVRAELREEIVEELKASVRAERERQLAAHKPKRKGQRTRGRVERSRSRDRQ